MKLEKEKSNRAPKKPAGCSCVDMAHLRVEDH